MSNGSPLPRNNMFFSGLKVDFTRSAGRVVLHDGVVRGPVLGGTIDGHIDYGADNMDLRGTLIPLYGANNLLGQLPVVGLFLGGEKEGLVGVTYEVVGKPGNPVLHVNPLSALAPGLLRKVFEFPANPTTLPPPPGDDSTGAVDATAIITKRRSSLRLEQDVALAAERELDHAARCEIFPSQQHLFIGDRRVVYLEPAILDLTSGLAIRRHKPSQHKSAKHA